MRGQPIPGQLITIRCMMDAIRVGGGGGKGCIWRDWKSLGDRGGMRSMVKLHAVRQHVTPRNWLSLLQVPFFLPMPGIVSCQTTIYFFSKIFFRRLRLFLIHNLFPYNSPPPPLLSPSHSIYLPSSLYLLHMHYLSFAHTEKCLIVGLLCLPD